MYKICLLNSIFYLQFERSQRRDMQFHFDGLISNNIRWGQFLNLRKLLSNLVKKFLLKK